MIRPVLGVELGAKTSHIVSSVFDLIRLKDAGYDAPSQKNITRSIASVATRDVWTI